MGKYNQGGPTAISKTIKGTQKVLADQGKDPDGGAYSHQLIYSISNVIAPGHSPGSSRPSHCLSRQPSLHPSPSSHLIPHSSISSFPPCLLGLDSRSYLKGQTWAPPTAYPLLEVTLHRLLRLPSHISYHLIKYHPQPGAPNGQGTISGPKKALKDKHRGKIPRGKG